MFYRKITSLNPVKYKKIDTNHTIGEYVLYLKACEKQGHKLDNPEEVKTIAEWLESEI
jgi:hypothetical protein